MIGVFPFGQEVKKVLQTDHTPKRVFVLGVYASAVHARWINSNGGLLVEALAVSTEPYIFWRGEGADEIINATTIPQGLGRLEPAWAKFNGPSGIALDDLYLAPMGLGREDAWLCDLVPHSCFNPGQKCAIEREYVPVMQRYQLPEPSVPSKPKVLSDDIRRSEIMDEIRESEAEVLVLLGDEPVKWFLHQWSEQWQKLADFGTTIKDYGILHPVQLDGITIKVLPLVHPRQSGRLGHYSPMWYKLHQEWLDSKNCSIFE